MSQFPQHKARKRFGQNFLHDAGVIDRIIRSIRPRENDHLVEIGPGQGAITSGLLASGAQLDVVELDKDLHPILMGQFGFLDRFRLHKGDALKFDFRQLVAGDEKLRVVGNLPYNISTPLMFRLLEQSDCIEDMHFMLQKEVVQRLAATAGKITVVEVEEIVEPGELDPAEIHTPGIYVDRLIQGTFEKRIEKRTVHQG